jgi:phospholipid/cholesterol/gamma-HCH transport system permease protein
MSGHSKTASEYSIVAEEESGGSIVLSVTGSMSLHTLTSIHDEFHSLMEKTNPSRISVDLGGVDYLDSAGVLAIQEMEKFSADRSIPCVFTNMSDDARGILSLVKRSMATAPSPSPPRKETGFMEQIGEISLTVLKDFADLMTFLGDLLVALFHALCRPGSIRWPDFIFYVRRAGLDGLPIVALLSFLLGLIIAFMSSLQLKQFGANLYVASLVGFGMVRELGPIMTAIIIAGRSGSAFAAEIGTMMVNEEVDALVTMGFNPTRFLALPKVLAAMVVVPLLTLYSDLFGILGGMLIGVLGFDLTAYTYIHQTIKSISIFDVVSSMIKAVVFAVLIAGIGCQRGFRVRGGAEAVGKYTTSAVVAGLFLIIVADSIFAIIFFYVR